MERSPTGLGQRIKAYVDGGGDKHDILDRADKHGALPRDRVKYNSDMRRDMRRHPDEYTDAQFREAGLPVPLREEYEEEGGEETTPEEKQIIREDEEETEIEEEDEDDEEDEE